MGRDGGGFRSRVGRRMAFGKRRMTICMPCSHFNRYTRLCDECGCFMPAKTKLKDSWCPIGKWGVEE